MSDDHDRQNRRRQVWLSEEQLEAIAQRAAERAINKVYTEVGKSTVRAALWVIGAGCAAILAWLGLSGKIPLK